MEKIEQLWCECVDAFNIESGILLHQSTLDPFRRVYVANGYIYKVVALQYEITSNFRAQNLAGEFAILKRCTGIKGVPSATAHHKTDEFEILVMERLPGEPLTNLSVGWLRLLIILAKLGIILLRLSWRGISHNDILPNNVLVTAEGSVSLVDFDQATRTKFLVALIRQFTGINIGGGQAHRSLISMVIKRYLKKKLSPRTIQFLRKLHAHMTRKELRTLPVLPDSASSQLKNLLQAWKIAQDSEANAPGQHLAYYSLSLEGYHFPGERPWIDRWDTLRSITDYSSKRILELGCNMGMLSTHLLKDCNVKAALAVDADAKILESAEHVGLAFDVRPILRRIDFDSDDDWEAELADFKADIVFALSVLNWVQDKQRLLNFLGDYAEVIFEGHDSVEVETNRLRTVGFRRFDIVGISERGRAVIHCQKQEADKSETTFLYSRSMKQLGT